MFNIGKCPKCEKAITSVDVEDVSLTVSLQPQWKGFSYHCPACRTVLGVQMNPLTLEVDIANRVLKAFGKQLIS